MTERNLTAAQLRYREYLKTPHWKATRARILLRAEEHCERCGIFCGPAPHDPDDYCFDESCEWCQSYFEDCTRTGFDPRKLEVHHVTYERMGRELDEDLKALCESCHDIYTERTIDLKRFLRSSSLAVKLANSPAAAKAHFAEIYQAIKKRLGLGDDDELI